MSKSPATRAEDDVYEADVTEVGELAKKYLTSIGQEGKLSERAEGMVREVVRPGGGEMHNIASLAGGVAAQEIVKVMPPVKQK